MYIEAHLAKNLDLYDISGVVVLRKRCLKNNDSLKAQLMLFLKNFSVLYSTIESIYSASTTVGNRYGPGFLFGQGTELIVVIVIDSIFQNYFDIFSDTTTVI